MQRREFIKGATYCGLALAFGGPLTPLPSFARSAKVGAGGTAAGASRAWEDFYRGEFIATRGDAQGFAFHCSNCQGNCAWRVFAKDGKVTRQRSEKHTS